MPLRGVGERGSGYGWGGGRGGVGRGGWGEPDATGWEPVRSEPRGGDTGRATGCLPRHADGATPEKGDAIGTGQGRLLAGSQVEGGERRQGQGGGCRVTVRGDLLGLHRAEVPDPGAAEL